MEVTPLAMADTLIWFAERGLAWHTAESCKLNRGMLVFDLMIVVFPAASWIRVWLDENRFDKDCEIESQFRPAKKHAAENVIQNNVARRI